MCGFCITLSSYAVVAWLLVIVKLVSVVFTVVNKYFADLSFDSTSLPFDTRHVLKFTTC